MWTFDKFFSEVTKILSKKKLHIFYMTKLTEHRIYLDKEENLEQFQLLLAQQCEVAPEHQVTIIVLKIIFIGKIHLFFIIFLKRLHGVGS
jgi:TANK-binding kinase 1